MPQLGGGAVCNPEHRPHQSTQSGSKLRSLDKANMRPLRIKMLKASSGESSSL